MTLTEEFHPDWFQVQILVATQKQGENAPASPVEVPEGNPI